MRTIGPGDIARLAMLEAAGMFKLRDEDAKECLAMGLGPFDAIAFSVGQSINSFLVIVDNEIVATWGYAIRSPLSGVGYPWLLTTPAIEKHKMFFARTSINMRDQLLQRFSRLDVLVDARYLRAQAWLEWLGFLPHNSAVPVNGVPFIYMQLEKK